MKVAIIIGTYNNQSHIADTIASVRSQSLSDWKAIVIDNGSSDESSNIAKKKYLEIRGLNSCRKKMKAHLHSEISVFR
jgi:glycosyltransferase involved in cell wall biosynthesis